MRIFGICIVKDEDDFLEEVISDAAQWADKIFIADNCSSDETVSVIQKLCRDLSNVIFVGILDKTFTDELIAEVYNTVRSASRPGDWWCRLDADEIYIDNPRCFLEKLPSHVDVVWSSHFSFRFTVKDMASYSANPEKFLAEPVTERLKFYLNDGSERRFVKHTRPFIWTSFWPKFRFSSSTKKIRLRQYQYRSPQQILKRVVNRRLLIESSKGTIFEHEMSEEQKSRFRKQSDSDITIMSKPVTADFSERVVATDDLEYFNGKWVERFSQLPTSWPVKPIFFPVICWKLFVLLKTFLLKFKLVRNLY